MFKFTIIAALLRKFQRMESLRHFFNLIYTLPTLHIEFNWAWNIVAMKYKLSINWLSTRDVIVLCRIPIK